MIRVPSGIRRGTSPEIKIDSFGGEDSSTVATQIAQNRSAKMENMMLDTQGMLQQIPGYRKAISGTVSIGATPVRLLTRNGVANKFIKSHGGKMYSFEHDGEETEIHSPVVDTKMRDFFMGSHQYFVNGSDFLRWDGSSAFETVESVAFIPTTVINRLPTGGGTTFEAVNLIQPIRKNSFVGNGSATVFQLDTVSLDAYTVSAVVAGVTITEGSGLTVNRTTGQVTFTTAPADGEGVDNVIITFAKTVSGYAERIKNCKFFAIFGIGNNLRVFLSGNSNYKNQDWYSGLQDPTYWPDLNYTKVGSEAVAIKGYALQQGVMHILKESSPYDPTIWTRTADIYTDDTIYFPVRQNNSQIGLLATDSVKGVDDISLMLTKNGVYGILTTYVSDERGLKHISSNIDKKLLAETNLSESVSFDFDGKYGIAINNKVYVVDYSKGEETYTWNGIPASCFYEHDSELFFGDNISGNVFVMNKIGDGTNTNMFDGKAIESFWYSKMFSMERANFFKMIDALAVTLIPVSVRSNVDIYYTTNKRTEKYVKSMTASKFGLSDIDLNYFTLNLSDLPQTENREINVSDIIYFQIILKNSNLGMGMAISNITIPYSLAGEI